MSLLETIQSVPGDVIGHLAGRTGLERSEVDQALRALVPEIGRAMRRATENRSVSAPAIQAITRNGRYERYLDQPARLDEPAAVDTGREVLHDLFGGQEDAREVAEGVALAVGVDADAIARLLPLAATLAAGALSRELRATTPQSGHVGAQGEEHGAPLARALASVFGDEGVALDKKP